MPPVWNPKRMFRRRPVRRAKRGAEPKIDASTSLKELATRSLVRSVDEYVQDSGTTYADVREMAEGLAWWPPEAIEKVRLRAGGPHRGQSMRGGAGWSGGGVAGGAGSAEP